MMPRSLSQAGPGKRCSSWPRGTSQIIALLLVLLIDSLVASHFHQVVPQDGRLFGSPISTLNRAMPMALPTIGMMLVIVTGDIDLSVGAVMAITGATAVLVTVTGHSLVVMVLASLGVGALVGLWNGILMVILKIQPFVATLILVVAGHRATQLIAAGQTVTFDSLALAWPGSGSSLLFSTSVIIAAAILLLFWLFTRKTTPGMFTEAVGTNIRATKSASVNTRIVVMLAYVLSGVCAATVGIIMAADICGADANNTGSWLGLDTTLAVTIGGASLMSRCFNLLLSVMGALIIQGTNTDILLSGLPPGLNQMVKAVAVLCVLIIQSLHFIGLLKGVRGHDKT